MITRATKRKRARSGIQRVSEREWPIHHRWVRSQNCVVPGCPNPAQCAHLRTAANSGKGQKPHSWYCAPICAEHHAEQEGRTKSFERKYGVDLFAVAADLTRRSPDWVMIKAMREWMANG